MLPQNESFGRWSLLGHEIGMTRLPSAPSDPSMNVESMYKLFCWFFFLWAIDQYEQKQDHSFLLPDDGNLRIDLLRPPTICIFYEARRVGSSVHFTEVVQSAFNPWAQNRMVLGLMGLYWGPGLLLVLPPPFGWERLCTIKWLVVQWSGLRDRNKQLTAHSSTPR